MDSRPLLCFLVFTLITTCVHADVRLPKELFDAEGEITALTGNERYLAAGSGDNKIYVFDSNGNLLLSKKFQDQITAIDIHKEKVAAASMEGHLKVFNVSQREQLYNISLESPPGYEKALSLHGDYLAVGTRSGMVQLYQNGNFNWERDSDSYVLGVKADERGVTVVSNKQIYSYNTGGIQVWKTNFSSYIRSCALKEKYSAIGLGNNQLVLVDDSGQSIWRKKVASHIGAVEMDFSQDKVRYVACGVRSGEVYVFTDQGKKIYEKKLDDSVVSLAMNSGKVLVGSLNNKLYYINPKQETLWVQNTQGDITATHYEQDYLAAGSVSGQVYYLDLQQNPGQVLFVTSLVIISLFLGAIVLIASLRT